jgi:hypothetical protein
VAFSIAWPEGGVEPGPGDDQAGDRLATFRRGHCAYAAQPGGSPARVSPPLLAAEAGETAALVAADDPRFQEIEIRLGERATFKPLR